MLSISSVCSWNCSPMSLCIVSRYIRVNELGIVTIYIYYIYIRVAVPQLVVGVVLPTLNMNGSAWTIIITGSAISLYPVFSHVDLVTETVLQSPRACSHTSPTEASDNAKARSTYSILVSVCKGSLYC